MRIIEKDIAYEKDGYWVLRIPRGPRKGQYDVYRNGLTHSTQVCFTGRTGDKGFKRAVEMLNYFKDYNEKWEKKNGKWRLK